MTDMENELAEGLEQDLGIKAMAEKLAPRGVLPQTRAYIQPGGGTIESKLLAIEKLIGEVRQLTAQIRERL